MIFRKLFELIPEVWEAYRPWLPLRAVNDFLTNAGHPGSALVRGGHWAVLAFVAVAAVLVGVSNGRRRVSSPARQPRFSRESNQDHADTTDAAPSSSPPGNSNCHAQSGPAADLTNRITVAHADLLIGS
jgi:hypothetical protein